jgi:hypothetical protein
VEGGRTMENATAITGTGAKPFIPEPISFALLLQALAFSGAENAEGFCMKTAGSGGTPSGETPSGGTLSGEQVPADSGQQTETLPAAGAVLTAPEQGPIFFSAGLLPGGDQPPVSIASAVVLPDAAQSPVSLISAVVLPDGGQSPFSTASAGALPAIEHPLPPAASKEPFIPAGAPNSERELQQKISLPLENHGMEKSGSENSVTSRFMHGESGKAPTGERIDFLPRQAEKRQIPTGQAGQAVPERVVPAVFFAYGSAPQQELSWLSGAAALLQPESVLEQVLVKIQYFAQQGTEELQVKLHPETLGEMKVKVRSELGVLMAEITVSHAGVKELLDGQLDLLRQRFKQLNLPVDVISVLVEYGGQEGPPSQREKESLFFNQDRMMIGESGSSRSGAAQQAAPVFAGGVGINVLA